MAADLEQARPIKLTSSPRRIRCVPPSYRDSRRITVEIVALLRGPNGSTARSAHFFAQAVGSLADAATHAASDPLTTIDWGMDVAVRAVRLLDRHIAGSTPSALAI